MLNGIIVSHADKHVENQSSIPIVIGIKSAILIVIGIQIN
jgi:hypothetical protein